MDERIRWSKCSRVFNIKPPIRFHAKKWPTLFRICKQYSRAGGGQPSGGNNKLRIGTSPDIIDTDNDGISDSAEIAQGLDPLDDRGFPTGIIASLPLQGEATGVTIEGGLDGSDRTLAYLATGSHGLTIVDVSPSPMDRLI